MYASNYFRATYFRAVWPAGAIGPKITMLANEAVEIVDAAARFLGLQRLPAEVVAYPEVTARSRARVRIRALTVELPETAVKKLEFIVELTRVMVEQLQASETAQHVRGLIKSVVNSVAITELTRVVKVIFITLVHGGIRLGALIRATLRVNKR